MNKLCFLLFLLLSAGLVKAQKSSELIVISTSNTNLIYKVGADHRLYQTYLGSPLKDISGLPNLFTRAAIAYATFGTDNINEPAIRVTHNDGNPSLELEYVSHGTEKKDENVTLTQIKLKDPKYPVEVTLFMKAYFRENVIEKWVEIRHKEKNPILLFNYASSMLHFDANKYWLTQFHGDWAEEMKMQESELTSGIKIIDSKLGTRANMYQTPVFYLSLNSKSDENSGELIAGTLGWSGNFQFLLLR